MRRVLPPNATDAQRRAEYEEYRRNLDKMSHSHVAALMLGLVHVALIIGSIVVLWAVLK